MADHRTEDQKIAAIAAGEAMEGRQMSQEEVEMGRRILRGEITGDQAVLELLERFGYGDSERADQLRRRIAEAMQP